MSRLLSTFIIATAGISLEITRRSSKEISHTRGIKGRSSTRDTSGQAGRISEVTIETWVINPANNEPQRRGKRTQILPPTHESPQLRLGDFLDIGPSCPALREHGKDGIYTKTTMAQYTGATLPERIRLLSRSPVRWPPVGRTLPEMVWATWRRAGSLTLQAGQQKYPDCGEKYPDFAVYDREGIRCLPKARA
jgi:hypothetical protein